MGPFAQAVTDAITEAHHPYYGNFYDQDDYALRWAAQITRRLIPMTLSTIAGTEPHPPSPNAMLTLQEIANRAVRAAHNIKRAERADAHIMRDALTKFTISL